MPFDMLRDLGVKGKIVAAILVLALAWLAMRTGVLAALLALGVTSPTVIGLAGIALVGYWAISEAEEGDEADDVIEKVANRAESATAGFVDGTTALILGGISIAMTTGMQFLGLLNNLLDIGALAPMVTVQVGTILAGLGAGVGLLSPTVFAAVALGLLFVGVLAKRRGSSS